MALGTLVRQQAHRRSTRATFRCIGVTANDDVEGEGKANGKHRSKPSGPKPASAKEPVKAKGAAKAEAELWSKSIPVRKDMTVPGDSQNKSSSEEPESPDEKEEKKKKKKKGKGQYFKI